MARSKKSANVVNTVTLDLRTIQDEASLHVVFAHLFGFPKTYGKNLDALVDCLTSLDNPTTNMCQLQVTSGACLTLILEGLPAFRTAHRPLWDILQDVLFFVNHRRLDQGQPPLLALAANRN